MSEIDILVAGKGPSSLRYLPTGSRDFNSEALRFHKPYLMSGTCNRSDLGTLVLILSYRAISHHCGVLMGRLKYMLRSKDVIILCLVSSTERRRIFSRAFPLIEYPVHVATEVLNVLDMRGRFYDIVRQERVLIQRIVILADSIFNVP
jgi:hypothetical protein